MAQTSLSIGRFWPLVCGYALSLVLWRSAETPRDNAGIRADNAGIHSWNKADNAGIRAEPWDRGRTRGFKLTPSSFIVFKNFQSSTQGLDLSSLSLSACMLITEVWDQSVPPTNTPRGLGLANYTLWNIRKRRFLTVINISEHGKGVPEAPTNRILVYHNYKLLVRPAPDGVTIIVIWKRDYNVNEVHRINITPQY